MNNIKKSFFIMLVMLLFMFVPFKVYATNSIEINYATNSYSYVLESATQRYTTQVADNKPSETIKGNCDNSLKDLLHHYWKWVMFATPILLIVVMTMDFIKAMASGDADSIRKSTSNAIKRVIAGIILLALPWALEVLFGWFGLEICF